MFDLPVCVSIGFACQQSLKHIVCVVTTYSNMHPSSMELHVTGNLHPKQPERVRHNPHVSEGSLKVRV